MVTRMNLKYKLSLIALIFVQIILISSSQAFCLFINTNQSIHQSSAIIADHTIANMVRLDQIPESAIVQAKNTLHIAYGHTSHGSQITSGMTGLPAFKEAQGGTDGLYDWNNGGTDGALDLHDYFMSGDLGNPDRISWANRTRTYLENSANADVNVVMWSWCGQAATSDPADIQLYLDVMTELETEYPSVTFVYMTGHTNGGGLDGDLHLRNNQIRDHCIQNNKVLFDFEDIESYDPDGNYFGDLFVTDTCAYHNDTYSGNWATEWQNAHTLDVDWYNCGSAHSEPLNANMKAYAAWWLWAVLTGWNSPINSNSSSNPSTGSYTSPTSSSQGGNNTGLFPTNFPAIWISILSISIIILKRKK